MASLEDAVSPPFFRFRSCLKLHFDDFSINLLSTSVRKTIRNVRSLSKENKFPFFLFFRL